MVRRFSRCCSGCDCENEEWEIDLTGCTFTGGVGGCTTGECNTAMQNVFTVTFYQVISGVNPQDTCQFTYSGGDVCAGKPFDLVLNVRYDDGNREKISRIQLTIVWGAFCNYHFTYAPSPSADCDTDTQFTLSYASASCGASACRWSSGSPLAQLG